MIASVVIDIMNKQVNRSFDYIIPSHLESIIKVGYRVRVGFGKTIRVGFVVEIKETTDWQSKMKEIVDVVDIYRPLNEEFVNLAKYIAENNFSFYATALNTMIPTALKIKYKKIAVVTNKEAMTNEAKELFKRNELILDGLNTYQMSLVYNEVTKGNAILDTKFKKNKEEAKKTFVYVDSDVPFVFTSKKGLELYDYLSEIGEPIDAKILLEDSGYSKGVLDTLIKTGCVKTNVVENLDTKEEVFEIEDKVITLNKDQQKAFDIVKPNISKTYLLHGVTGSGKTEVYMHMIKRAIEENKTAIMLVPEISLTPQITALFYARFKSDIAILHSRLSIKEKYIAWKKILNHEVKIVVGARSAIFAPLDNLGIIIVDEAHESTYKQINNPKYDAIEIAKLRSKTHNCPIVLGSATPRVSDYYLATNGEYELIRLPNRTNGKDLPKSVVVDMREELKKGNKSVFSYELQKEIINTFKNKEQSILFLNRRGHSSFVMCRSCGETVKCPHCDISLTYHAHNQSLKCHYCGYQMPNVIRCEKCGSDKIRYVGSGTEKIVDEVYKLIPEARVLRLDMDTTTKLENYEDAFKKFRNHEADILVGTQMIAKGLDFESVTLVGVINADLALSYPTYDATEVAYDLIEQVSGRAGRASKDGKVIIQTYKPTHYVINASSSHDYESFYNFEIQSREIQQMPPFSEVIEIMVTSKDASLAHKTASHIAGVLSAVSEKSQVLGPAEAFVFKVNDTFRFTIEVLAVEDAILDKLKYIYPLYQDNKDVSISITRM